MNPASANLIINPRASTRFQIRLFLERYHVEYLFVLLDKRNILYLSAFDVARILKHEAPYDWALKNATDRYGNLIAPAVDMIPKNRPMIEANFLVATVLKQKHNSVRGAHFLRNLVRCNEKVIDDTAEHGMEYTLRSCQCAKFNGIYFSSWLTWRAPTAPFSKGVCYPPVATTPLPAVHYPRNFRIQIFLPKREVDFLMGILDEQHAVYLSAVDVARIMKIKQPCAWATRQTKIIYGDLIAPAVDCVRQKCPMIETTHLMEKVLKPACKSNQEASILVKILQGHRKIIYDKISEGEHFLRACRCAEFHGRSLKSWFDQLKRDLLLRDPTAKLVPRWEPKTLTGYPPSSWPRQCV